MKEYKKKFSIKASLFVILTIGLILAIAHFCQPKDCCSDDLGLKIPKKEEKTITNKEKEIVKKENKVKSNKKKKTRRDRRKKDSNYEAVESEFNSDLDFSDLDLKLDDEISKANLYQEENPESKEDTVAQDEAVGIDLTVLNILNPQKGGGVYLRGNYWFIKDQVSLSLSRYSYGDTVFNEQRVYFKLNEYLDTFIGRTTGKSDTRSFGVFEQGLGVKYEIGKYNLEYEVSISPYSIDDKDFVSVSHLGFLNYQFTENWDLKIGGQVKSFNTSHEDSTTPLEMDFNLLMGLSISF
jgi:hypothetical protein